MLTWQRRVGLPNLHTGNISDLWLFFHHQKQIIGYDGRIEFVCVSVLIRILTNLFNLVRVVCACQIHRTNAWVSIDNVQETMVNHRRAKFAILTLPSGIWANAQGINGGIAIVDSLG